MISSMEKKRIVIIAILAILILVGILFAIVYDSSINNCILEINDVKYTIEDFESYLKVYSYETPIEKGKSEAEYIRDAYDNYVSTNMYYHAAHNIGGLGVNDTIKNSLTERYNASKESFEKANITLDEYIAVYGKVEVANDLFSNASEYYEVTNELLQQSIGDDKIETYSYRVLQVSIPAVETTTKDEDGNEVELNLTEEEKAQKAKENKDTAKSKAEEALKKIRDDGEAFEEIAKEYGMFRFVPTLEGGYTVVNGNLEVASDLILESKIGNEKLYKELQKLKAGEYSEIVEDENSFSFVKLEEVTEGLNEDENKELKDQIAAYMLQTAIPQSTGVIRNLPMLKKITLPNIPRES